VLGFEPGELAWVNTGPGIDMSIRIIDGTEYILTTFGEKLSTSVYDLIICNSTIDNIANTDCANPLGGIAFAAEQPAITLNKDQETIVMFEANLGLYSITSSNWTDWSSISSLDSSSWAISISDQNFKSNARTTNMTLWIYTKSNRFIF